MMKNDMAHILIVEDDDQLAELLMEYLGLQGYELTRVATGEDGVSAILKNSPDLVILDLMLPGIGGLDVCRQVRGTYSGAILMLTASQSESDHVAGLELGADDFVNKPIEPRILLARIRTQLRRFNDVRTLKNEAINDIIDIGPLRLDMRSREVSINGRPVALTTMEFDILSMLARDAGSVVKREDLYLDIMEVEYDGINRGMDVHVSRIRQKLQQAGFDPNQLKSVRSAGYLLVSR